MPKPERPPGGRIAFWMLVIALIWVLLYVTYVVVTSLL